MNAPRTVEIVGGGLAGLSLGLALARAGVPVVVFEAGNYPRHRVCGEFVAGLDALTDATLGLAPFFAEAKRHRRVSWFSRGRRCATHALPAPALGLSRHMLDASLAENFQRVGGRLEIGTRIDLTAAPEGRVFACGRRRTSGSAWVGLKAHVRGLRAGDDLEVHLGREAYFGVCAIEDDSCNVCGLLRRQALPATRARTLEFFSDTLRRCGLGELSMRVAAAALKPGSLTAVAGISFAAPEREPGRLCLGDALGMIPPFTGHGMTIAFQSAALALAPLCAWAKAEMSWGATVATAQRALRTRLDAKLRLARGLHPWLLSPARQRVFSLLQRARLLPIRPLLRTLHA
jgi:2-polyprenyl-6-methoxyphenol hydroxylase-like FAD-dependent oxidoreductase